MQPLALKQRPFFEWSAIGERKAGQKITTIQLGRLCQPGHTGSATRRRIVPMRAALGQQAGEQRDVKRVIAGGGELHAVAAGQQKRRFALAQQTAQIGQRHSQIATSCVLRCFGPEQAQ